MRLRSVTRLDVADFGAVDRFRFGLCERLSLG
jgi:hypothetical protein